MMLNKLSLNTIGLNRIGLNRIGKPSRGSSGRPYIDPEVLASLKAVCICYGKSNDDPDRAIVKNLVDPDNPFIISNAAYKLNSGYGLYGMDFLEWKSNSGMSFTSTKLTSTKPNLSGGWLTFRNVSGLIPETKVKVSGAPREFGFIANNNGTDDKFSVTINNGVYTIPEFTLSSASGFYINNNSGDWSNLVIEQIPSFEGAFVTDGIDDLIKSTKSATEMLDGSNEVTVVSMIHQIKTNDDTTRNNWFFTPVSYLENRVVKDKIGKTGIYGYTSTNVTNAQISDITPILGDKNDYTLYSKIEDGDRDYFTVEGFQNQGIWYVSSIAWYWTIIANKVLTTDQINQVIAYYNLDRCVEPTVLYDVKRQGLSNDTPDSDWYLKDFSKNGFDMSLFNFAKKGNSGVGKYEADFLSWSYGTGLKSRTHDTFLASTDQENNPNVIIGIVNYIATPTSSDIDSFVVDVKIEGEAYLSYFYVGESDTNTRSRLDIKSSGRYTIPKSYNSNAEVNISCGFYIGGLVGTVEVTQIPSHAGALCFDGVEDYGKVTGMPIYKDFTVIANRRFIGAHTGAVISKSYTGGSGAFYFESGESVASFGLVTRLVVKEDIDISYLSRYVYKGDDIQSGTAVDSDKMWLGILRDNDPRFSNIAIYSLMSFPYSMSEFLIERQLKKHKLGTLYPNMVEFRPIVNSNVEWNTIEIWQADKPLYRPAIGTNETGTYLQKDSTIGIYVKPKGVDEVTKIVVNGTEYTNLKINSNGFYYVTLPITTSPQKIDITIDEYIRYEDMDFTSAYPFIPIIEGYTWGDKLKVGDKVTYKVWSNMLTDLYSRRGEMKLNGENILSNSSITVEKSMKFEMNKVYLKSNEPKCILSPSRLRIPNSSYKILGYIPDISGHGNHGKINNSAYAEGSGVNADGSYQLDGVDDFITIPTLTNSGKQILMKINWNTESYNKFIADFRGVDGDKYYIVNELGPTVSNLAYQNVNKTYIDGIFNNNIKGLDLKGITHNITSQLASVNSSPYIGARTGNGDNLTMALYDFMLFDEISTDEEILTLNEYVGIEGNTDDLFTENN